MNATTTTTHPSPGDTASHPTAGVLPPIVVVGFATAVAMWCLWFITHLPALGLPIDVAGPILIAVQFLALVAGCALVPASQSVMVGLGAGLLCGLINLVILGTRLSEPIAAADGAASVTALRPDALSIVLGSLGLSLLMGGIGGGIGAILSGRRATQALPARAWLARFAIIAAVTALPLLTLGGVVTSTASGLAVPDWPGTYGSNMFLYPISLMAEPRIYFEHTHRLFGILVGLTTIGLLAFTLAVDRRRWVWGLAGLLLALVVLQGLLGAYRVTHTSQWLAVGHGVLGQIFFCTLCIHAAVVSRGFLRAHVAEDLGSAPADEWAIQPLSRRARTMGILTLAFIALQLVFGAMYRHLHTPHALYAHIGFSFIIVIHAIILGSVLTARSGAQRPAADIRPLDRKLTLLGKFVLATVFLQFVIGWAVLLVVLRLPPEARAIPTADQLAAAPAIPPLTSLVRTLHQANGACVFALTALAAAWAIRLRPTR